MKTKFITAFYTDLKGFPYFCHDNPARHDRYLHSLRVLDNMHTEIICYCNNSQYDLLDQYIHKFNLKNIKVKISNLQDFNFASKMIRIKQDTNNFLFYHEIDWNKIYLLDKEYDVEYDYIYWIDVGLSHPGLFPNKYNPNHEYSDGMSNNFFTYSFLNLFSSTLVNKLNQFCNDKLITIQNEELWHNTDDINKYLDGNFKYKALSVGGIIGGHTSKLRWFIDYFNLLADKCLNQNFILNHEAIISFIYESKPEYFNNFIFQTWYHPDYPNLDDFRKNNLVHFSDFFDLILQS